MRTHGLSWTIVALALLPPGSGCRDAPPHSCEAVTQHFFALVVGEKWREGSRSHATLEAFGLGECERGRRKGRYTSSAMRCALRARTEAAFERCDLWSRDTAFRTWRKLMLPGDAEVGLKGTRRWCEFDGERVRGGQGLVEVAIHAEGGNAHILEKATLVFDLTANGWICNPASTERDGERVCDEVLHTCNSRPD